MIRTTTRLIKSEHTTTELRAKLAVCGSRTATGHWVWCRSPGCDCCRRYRGRYIAEAIADWTDTIVASHRVQRIEIGTGMVSTPDRVLDEIADIRLRMRRAYHYRQCQDDRWGYVQHYGCWSLAWNGAAWSGMMRGVIYHGPINEIRYLDEVGGPVGVRLIAFDRAVIRLDVRDHMYRAFSGVSGLAKCEAADLSMAYNAIHHRGGYKSLISRRGM
jgi:hypothetical protein